MAANVRVVTNILRSKRRFLLASTALTGLLALALSIVTVWLAATDQQLGNQLLLLQSLVILGVLAFGAQGVLLYLIDSRRFARRSISTLEYSRLTAERTRRIMRSQSEQLERPMPVTAKQLESQFKAVENLLESQHENQLGALKSAAALLLDDLDRGLRHIESVSADASHTREGLESLDQKMESLGKKVDSRRTEEELDDFGRRFYPLIEGIVSVYATLNPPLPLGQMRDWAISPDLASYIVQLTLRNQPQLIVEAGSGISTVLFGMCLKKIGAGRVISLEHEESFAEITRNWVDNQSLSEYVDVRQAPLVSYDLDGRVYSWYDLTDIEFSPAIDLLFVDGPPGSIGQRSRYPALPVLRDYLGSESLVVLDDANRSDESSILEDWSSNYGPLSIDHIEHEKGTAVIRKT